LTAGAYVYGESEYDGTRRSPSYICQHAYTQAQRQARFSVSPEEQDAVQRLAQDLPAVWQAPTTTDQERKQLLRKTLAEVQLDGVTIPGKIDIRVLWRSGAVTRCQIERLKVGAWVPRTDERVIERIRTWAPTHTVANIVERLNQEDLRSALGRAFCDHHVLYLARQHHIVVTSAVIRPSTPRGRASAKWAAGRN
jgi:hypothetical protein